MKAKLILSFFLVLFVKVSWAETVYVCDSSCSGNYSKAVEVSQSYPSGTLFSVIDVENDVVDSYESVQRYMPAAGEYIYMSTPVPVTANAISVLDDLLELKQSADELKVEVPGDVADSVHDVITTSSIANDVSDYVGDFVNRDFLDNATLFLNRLGSMTQLIEVPLAIKVEFSDGSSAIYILTHQTTNGETVFEIAEGSARDSDNNSLPEDQSDIPGTWLFTNDSNWEAFIDVADTIDSQLEWRFDFQCKNVMTTICNSSGICTTYISCF